MTRLLKVLVVASSVVAGAATAHEKDGRAMGVVESVTPDRIVIKTGDGHPVAFRLTRDTRYFVGEKPADVGQVRAGQRAVVQGTGSGETLTAVRVKLGVPSK